MTRGYAHAGPEPPLREVLRDPIVRLVMRRDGVELQDVESAIAAARRRLFPTAGEPHGSFPRKAGNRPREGRR